MVAYLCCSSCTLILTLNMENLRVEQKDMIWKLNSLSLIACAADWLFDILVGFPG